jgi:hypothetical protein
MGSSLPIKLLQDRVKKYGGNVLKDMNGWLLLPVEMKVLVAPIAEGEERVQIIAFQLLIRLWLNNGILPKTVSLLPIWLLPDRIRKYGGHVKKGMCGML